MIEIRRGADGRYRWPGTMNGTSVDFLVDTGASGVAIPAELAERLRLQPRSRALEHGRRLVNGTLVRADLTLERRARRRLPWSAPPRPALLGIDISGACTRSSTTARCASISAQRARGAAR